MKTKGNTLHFIHRLDETNCGDMCCSPLLYYYDFFKQYRICCHDIRYIDYKVIAPEDVVILGGGGLLNYSEALNRNINRLLDTGACVITWAPGFNTHTGYSGRPHMKIDFSRFTLINTRDYENSAGLPYLPDVTCKMKALHKEYTIKREIGIARHKDCPISQFDYEEITNSEPMERIVQFIGESQVILSNSYHMIYWALLMGKKVVCVDPFSSRFFGYQHKPVYYTAGDNLQECIQQASTYDVLEECIRCNDEFFGQVAALVRNHLTPSAEDQIYDSAMREALAYGRLRETQLMKGDAFSVQLFLDTGEGFNEGQKLVAINNVYGDDTQTVEFDLSAFPALRALRFDPLERHCCQVQILEAVSELGPVTLQPMDYLRTEQWDRFLTTDPQYLIDDPCGSFLKIRFRLELVPDYMAEQAIKYRLWQDCQEQRRLTVSIQEKEREQSQITMLLREKEQKQRQLTMLIQEKEQEQHRLTELLQAKEQEITEARQNIESVQERLIQQAAQLDGQRHAAQAQEQELQQRCSEIASQQRQIAMLRAALENEQQMVECMRCSRSWRITAPLRALTALIRNFWRRG